MLRAAQPSTRVVASMWPTSGAEQLVAGVGRVAKETGHHPSRGPGSVLNCLPREAELSAGGGWRGGNGTVALAPAPTPPPRAQVDRSWEGGGTGTQGWGPGARQEWLRGGFDTAQRVTQRDEHFWGHRLAAVLPCQTQAFTVWGATLLMPPGFFQICSALAGLMSSPPDSPTVPTSIPSCTAGAAGGPVWEQPVIGFPVSVR